MANPDSGHFPLPLFILFLIFALAIDFLLSWIPGVGTVSIFIFRLVLSGLGVHTKGINWLMWGGAVSEAIPFISLLPAISAFLVIVYIQAALGISLPAMPGQAVDKAAVNNLKISQAQQEKRTEVNNEEAAASESEHSAIRPALQPAVPSPAPETEAVKEERQAA